MMKKHLFALTVGEQRILDGVLTSLAAGQPGAAIEEQPADEEQLEEEVEVLSEPPRSPPTSDIDAIFYRIALLEERVAPAEQTVARIEKRLPPLEVGAVVLEKRQQSVEKLIREFNQRIEAMETLVQQVAAFASRLEAMETKSRAA